MKKKVLSAVLALTLVFGSAAALPKGVVTDTAGIAASAADTILVSGDYKYKVLSDGAAQITDYTGKASTLTIPSTLGGKTVTSIGKTAFTMSTTLTSVTIPDSITEIGYGAFTVCSKLTTVKLGSGLSKIGMYAFAQSGLTSISIPASVKQIGQYAFDRCKSLKTVTIASGESATVDNYAFEKCSALTKVDFGSTVSTIGSFAFQGCTSLTSLTIPESVKSINQRAFAECTKLTNVKLGNGLKTLGVGAFILCTGLKNVTFGKSLESIGNSAFEDCTSLTGVTLMPSTKTIDESAFSGCVDMTSAVLSGAEVIGPKAFSYCIKLTDVTFFEKVRAIGENSFMNCEELVTVNIPDNAKEIREHSFGFGYKDGEYKKRVGFTICGEKNSEAQKYADANGFTFKDTDSHAHTYKAIVVPNTCTTGGYTLSICKTCGETKTAAETKANGHPGGTYYRTTAFDTTAKTSTQTGVCTVCGGEVKKTTKNAITRLEGRNRSGTAAAISAAEYPSTVILANSMNYADALAGVPLSKKLNAPILLTNTDSIDQTTLDEIKRLGATKVVILGGEGAVSQNVVNTLISKGIAKENITRIAGKSRFGTAAEIAKKLGSAPTEVFFVYGLDYADALSVSTVATIKNAPIIYLTTKGDMNAETATYLKTLMGKVTTAYIIGGEGVISNDMMKKVGTHLLLGDSSVVRVAGKNRYETCTEVNSKFSSLLSSDGICVAKGLDFPDALAGGVYAAKNGLPLFLADGSALKDPQRSYLKEKNPARITVFGGQGAVSDALIGVVANASVKA